MTGGDRPGWRRRDLLRHAGLGALGVGLAGCTNQGGDGSSPGGGGSSPDGDGSPGDGGGGSQSSPADEDSPTGETDDGGCTPGHTAGNPACEQIASDAEVLTGFDASGTALPVGFDYPCGWTTSATDQFEDRVQVNATRSEIGDGNGYVDIQVRAYYSAVSEGFLDSKKEEGTYEEHDYEYDGATRRGLVSAKSNAQYGTLGHAVVPFDGSLVHVELVSTLHAESCSVEPRPDYGVVKEMLGSLRPNSDTTFTVEESSTAAESTAESAVAELRITDHEEHTPPGSDPETDYSVLLTVDNTGDQATDLSEYTYEIHLYDDAGNDITPAKRATRNWDEPGPGASGEITVQGLFGDSDHSPDDVARYEITLTCDGFDEGVYC